MTSAYGTWSGPAKALVVAVDAAVSAAQIGDADAFDDALIALYRVDREQLTVLLGAVTRDVLEQANPDGLDSDDAQRALDNCVRSAAGWYPAVDTAVVLLALIGALGLTEPDEPPIVDQYAVLVHGLLLIADLLASSGIVLRPLLEAALRELLRAQTVELP
ncbi:MAG: hypothetical protein ACR2LX_08445 [Jatrophihabitans sp.]